MKNEEEKFEALLSNTTGLESPSGKNYTNQIMQSIFAHHSATRYKKLKRTQLLYALLGLIACLSIVATLIILWKTGNLSQILTGAVHLIKPVLNMIPFEISPWMVGLAVLHFFFSRGLLTIYFLNCRLE